MKRSLKAKLRLRFVCFAMVILLTMQTFIVGISIYQNYRDLVTKSDMLISQLHNHPSGASRYFSVKLPAGEGRVYPDTVQHISVTAEEAAALARRVMAKEQEKGFLDGYRYRIYQNESGTKIYFLHRESSIETCKNAAKNMILFSVVGLLAMGILLIPVSGWVVKPIVDNHNRQKAFITSAGHALKTPLTVIRTNAQLLQSEIGENQWLTGIEKQVTHLTQMTQGLVTLSKAEEYHNPLVRERFSFTDALEEILEAYGVIAKQKGISLSHTAPEDLEYTGSREEIQQLLQLLVDNACKYCSQGGFVRITAKGVFHGVSISIVNTADISSEDATALLQRFHRGENAAGQAGFGLGLSIAQAIAHRHNGHLTASAATKGEFRVEVVLR